MIEPKSFFPALQLNEVEALQMRFGIKLNSDHSFEDVGRQFEITRERIRAIEEKALRKLRKNNDDDPNDDGPDAA